MSRFVAIMMLAVLLVSSSIQFAYATGSQPPTQEEILTCQQSLAAETEQLTRKLHSLLGACLKKIQSNIAYGIPAENAKPLCVKSITRFYASKSNARFRMIRDCANVHPELIGYPCDPEAYDHKDTARCLVENSARVVQELVGLEYPSACEMLNTVGMDQTYYHLCGQQ